MRFRALQVTMIVEKRSMTFLLGFLFFAAHAAHAQAPAPRATAKSIADIIAAAPTAKITTFIEAAKITNLYDKLTADSFTGTLLIPSDAAFVALFKALNATRTELLAEQNLLKTVLQYHVSTTVVPSMQAWATVGSIPTLLAGRALRGVNLGAALAVQGDVNNAVLSTSPNGISGLVGPGSTISAAVYTIENVLIPNMTISSPAQPMPPTVVPPRVAPTPITAPSPSATSTPPPVARSAPPPPPLQQQQASGSPSVVVPVVATVSVIAVVVVAAALVYVYIIKRKLKNHMPTDLNDEGTDTAVCANSVAQQTVKADHSGDVEVGRHAAAVAAPTHEPTTTHNQTALVATHGVATHGVRGVKI